jgi:signal transduction histidine kinase
VEVDGDPDERFPAQIETVVYRVAQEALANVARHARATQAAVEVSSGGDTLTCTIQDDGEGFEPEALRESNRWGLGLIGMRERVGALGGRLQITSAPGRGTIVTATIPLGGSHVHPRASR